MPVEADGVRPVHGVDPAPSPGTPPGGTRRAAGARKRRHAVITDLGRHHHDDLSFTASCRSWPTAGTLMVPCGGSASAITPAVSGERHARRRQQSAPQLSEIQRADSQSSRKTGRATQKLRIQRSRLTHGRCCQGPEQCPQTTGPRRQRPWPIRPAAARPAGTWRQAEGRRPMPAGALLRDVGPRQHRWVRCRRRRVPGHWRGPRRRRARRTSRVPGATGPSARTARR